MLPLTDASVRPVNPTDGRTSARKLSAVFGASRRLMTVWTSEERSIAAESPMNDLSLMVPPHYSQHESVLRPCLAATVRHGPRSVGALARRPDSDMALVVSSGLWRKLRD